MDANLKQKVDLMVENYNELKNSFKWENNLLKHFSAIIHATIAASTAASSSSSS
ncbi:hypothetical protein GOM49_13360 [Clostridium bovifaecis]|uniref:Uncharacterized protein n=1 Tax=Clostridium bovifaecis TaxID=2184719 RepID=A0A6I6F6H3_9CLOT|nr:hypothetical protein GOM49_13360 [Clostridium bovifaecis]